MLKEEKVLKEYSLWVKSGAIIKDKNLEPKGKTFLDTPYLSLHTEGMFSLTFINCTLDKVFFKSFELAHSDIHKCSFSACIIGDADIEYCAFDNVIFSRTSFNRTLFDHCIFNNCVFNYCGWERYMTNCNFYNCTFKNETKDFFSTHAIDETCTVSQCKGIPSPSDYLNEYFKRNESDTGYIVYKTFGSKYQPCKEWDISPGSIIYENCDPNRRNPCSYGINVAPIEWIRKYICAHAAETLDIWRCEILDKWLADVCVPYNTKGKIRCNKLRLIEIVE